MSRRANQALRVGAGRRETAPSGSGGLIKLIKLVARLHVMARQSSGSRAVTPVAPTTVSLQRRHLQARADENEMAVETGMSYNRGRGGRRKRIDCQRVSRGTNLQFQFHPSQSSQYLGLIRGQAESHNLGGARNVAWDEGRMG